MFKNNRLSFTYEDWQGGIASSPYAGIADMRNIDPFTDPVSLKTGFKAIEESDGVFDSFPRHATFDEVDNILYFGTADGQLVQRNSGGAYTDVSDGGVPVSEADECHGIAYWKRYVLYADDTHLHAYRIDSPNWFNDWQAFEVGRGTTVDFPHTMLVGQDDVLYITDGKYIASLQEQAGQTFNASSATTYTWNSTALDLPDGYVANTLTEYGTFLIIGTYFGEILNIGNRADTFPWDRLSASYNIPIRAKGNGVLASINDNNRLYTLIDKVSGKVAASNLSTYQMLMELRSIKGGINVNPDAIDVLNNEILMGIGTDSADVDTSGVYGMKNNFLHLKNVLSCGGTQAQIGSVTAIGDGDYVASWEQGSTYGSDLISNTRCDGYISSVTTPLYSLSKSTGKVLFNNCEIQLGKELSTGQGIKVYYRANLTDSFTLIHTFDYATWGATNLYNDNANIEELARVQFKIELTSAADSTESPEFLSMVFD